MQHQKWNLDEYQSVELCTMKTHTQQRVGKPKS